jgi:hypothetical protein
MLRGQDASFLRTCASLESERQILIALLQLTLESTEPRFMSIEFCLPGVSSLGYEKVL